MSYYPVTNNKNNSLRNSKNSNGSLVSVSNNGIPNIFKNQQEEFFFKKGRAHCQAIERTAIYKDAHGNKIVLKENTTTMNTDTDGPGLSYRNNGKTFKKKQKR